MVQIKGRLFGELYISPFHISKIPVYIDDHILNLPNLTQKKHSIESHKVSHWSVHSDESVPSSVHPL